MAVFTQLRVGHDALQRVHLDRASADRRKLTVHIDRDARHDFIGVVIVVPVHRAEIRLAVRGGARVPRTPPGVERQILPIRADLCLRRPIHDDGRAARQRHHAVQQRVTAAHDFQYRASQCADPADLLVQFPIRLVRPVGIDQLDRQLSRIFQRGSGHIHRRIPRGVLKNLLNLLRQDLEVVAHGPEFFVQQLCLCHHIFPVAVRGYLLHGSRHGVHDHGVLFSVGLPHDAGKAIHLKNTRARKQDHRHSDQSDHDLKQFCTKADFHTLLLWLLTASAQRP